MSAQTKEGRPASIADDSVPYFFFVVCDTQLNRARPQKSIADDERSSTIEAKIQSFIPGKLIVVRRPVYSRWKFSLRCCVACVCVPDTVCRSTICAHVCMCMYRCYTMTTLALQQHRFVRNILGIPTQETKQTMQLLLLM